MTLSTPGFSAAPGYDLATGWGSFDAPALLAAFAVRPPCTADGDCDDRNPCTVDRCGAKGCTSTVVPDGTSCQTDPCVTAACQAGACAAGGPVDCDDGDPCTEDQCGASGCVRLPARGQAAATCVVVSDHWLADLCPGESLPRRIMRPVDQARRLLEQTAGATAKKVRRLVRRTRQQLGKAGRAARASKRLSPACVAALSEQLAAASRRAEGLIVGP